MKLKHYALIAGGYLVAAYVFNKYAAASVGFTAPLDLLSSVLP